MVLSDDTSEPPVNLPTEAKDFIGKCLPQLDKDRWSAEQLLAHRFVAMKPTMSDKMDVIAPTKSEKGNWNVRTFPVRNISELQVSTKTCKRL